MRTYSLSLLARSYEHRGTPLLPGSQLCAQNFYQPTFQLPVALLAMSRALRCRTTVDEYCRVLELPTVPLHDLLLRCPTQCSVLSGVKNTGGGTGRATIHMLSHALACSSQ